MSRRANSEGTYTRRSNGRIQFREQVNGRRFSGTGRTRREAKATTRAKIQAAAPIKSPTTWATLLADWQEQPPSSLRLRPTTRDQYASVLRSRLLPALGNERPEVLNSSEIALVIDSARAPSTRRTLYAAWVKLSAFAVERGLLGVNTVRQFPRPPAADPPKREATPSEMTNLLQVASGHRWGIVAWLVILAGLRRGEALGLRWTDVDLDGQTLRVEGNLTRSSAGLIWGPPKTKHGRRQVPVPKVLADNLAAHRRRQLRQQSESAYWKWSGYVVTNEIGGPVEPRNMSKVWTGWAKQVGLTDRGMHLGRHYAATQLVSSGRASIVDIAAQMGHDPSMLMSTYAAAVADGQRAAADHLASTLSPIRITPEDMDSGAS